MNSYYDIATDIIRVAAPISNIVLALGAILLLLSVIERRAALIAGTLLLFIGGIASLSLSSDETPKPFVSQLAQPPDPSQLPKKSGSVASRARNVSDAKPVPVRDECTASLTDLDLDLSVHFEVTPTVDRQDAYRGFLTKLLPDSHYLPCAIRQARTRPLTLRSAAVASGKPEAAALWSTLEGGLDGIERTYGFACSAKLEKDEISVARIGIIRFDSTEAARVWEALPLDTEQNVKKSTANERAAWLDVNCAGSPRSALISEERVRNIVGFVYVEASVENMFDANFEAYSLFILDRILRGGL